MSETRIPLRVVENEEAVALDADSGVIRAVSPTVDLERVTDPNPGVKITVKDVRGTHSETVLDGEGGGGDIIDDTTPAADKVFSSSKVDGELNTVKSALTISDIKEKLLTGDIPGTTKTVTMDSDGNPVSIVHSNGNEAVRTDAFVWGENTVTETRTLASGKYITIQTNLITLETVVSAVQEVA